MKTETELKAEAFDAFLGSSDNKDAVVQLKEHLDKLKVREYDNKSTGESNLDTDERNAHDVIARVAGYDVLTGFDSIGLPNDCDITLNGNTMTITPKGRPDEDLSVRFFPKIFNRTFT